MPRFLLQSRHQMRPLSCTRTIMIQLQYCTVNRAPLHSIIFTISLVYFVRPRKEETLHTRQKKKRRKSSLVYCFFCDLTHLTPLLVVLACSQLTVQYFVRGRKMQSQERKKRPVLARSHSFSFHHGERRLSVPCACTVPYPEPRPLVPRCAHQLKVDRTLVLGYCTVVL